MEEKNKDSYSVLEPDNGALEERQGHLEYAERRVDSLLKVRSSLEVHKDQSLGVTVLRAGKGTLKELARMSLHLLSMVSMIVALTLVERLAYFLLGDYRFLGVLHSVVSLSVLLAFVLFAVNLLLMVSARMFKEAKRDRE